MGMEGDMSIAIPAKGTAVTPYYAVRISNILSHESLQTVLRVNVHHGGIVRIAGTVDVTIGHFNTRLHLEQVVWVCAQQAMLISFPMIHTPHFADDMHLSSLDQWPSGRPSLQLSRSVCLVSVPCP